MKKQNEFIVLILMIVMIAFMHKLSTNPISIPKLILSSELPVLSMANSENVFSLVHEENEDTDEEIKIEINATSPVITNKNAKVLIYHTHITESYAKSDNFTYTESTVFRTEEMGKNVSHIGSMLKDELTKSGIFVTHDTTNFEPPKLGTAYSRSLVMLENRIKTDGEYDIYIDIHRDAYDLENDVIVVDGKRIAKVMLVVGTGQGNNGKPILPLPDYKSNYAFAKQITDNINSLCSGLAKDVRVNKSRYNQHISTKAILIEMGYTGNNMEEVENAVPYVAKAISQMIK